MNLKCYFKIGSIKHFFFGKKMKKKAFANSIKNYLSTLSCFLDLNIHIKKARFKKKKMLVKYRIKQFHLQRKSRITKSYCDLKTYRSCASKWSLYTIMLHAIKLKYFLTFQRSKNHVPKVILQENFRFKKIKIK